MLKSTRWITAWLRTRRSRLWRVLTSGLFLLLCGAGVAAAADVRGGVGDEGIFRLSPEEVINDDLYVAGSEVYIDGRVEGDLVAAGGYVEVNGTVTGDVLLVGGGVVINGTVGDDARVAGGGVAISGRIADDLFVAGGGGTWAGAMLPMQFSNNRTIPQGVQLTNSATVGGDAYLVGGQGALNGSIEGDLFSGMGALIFAGQVQGDAQLYAERLEVRESARVAGTLRYGSDEARPLPAGVAASVVEAPSADEEIDRTTAPNPLWRILGWIWRTILVALGFASVVWLLWRLTPNFWRRGGAAVATRPAEAALYGIIAAALALPVVLAIIVLVALFWGWSGALAAATFLFGALGVLWLFSPVLTGYWLGQQLAARGLVASGLLATVAGALVIVLVARLVAIVPCVGTLIAGVIYLLSFAVALGGIILQQRQLVDAPVALPVQDPTDSSSRVRVYGNL